MRRLPARQFLVPEHGPRGIFLRSGENRQKKGALRALGYDAHAQTHDVVNVGAFTSDGGLHSRVQAVVGDREHWSWLAIGGRTKRILASKSLNVLLRRARTGPRGVRRSVELKKSTGYHASFPQVQSRSPKPTDHWRPARSQ